MKRRQHCVSCTDREWDELIGEVEAGLSLSQFILRCALAEEAVMPLVLTEEERRRLLDTVLRTAALLSGAMAAEVQDSLPGAVRALFKAKMDEMVRTGRYGEMRALLDTVLGAERATGIADHVYERWR